ncbi:MAG: type II toxin-antitoxin system VapC family toxin [Burkholderiales bacterium]
MLAVDTHVVVRLITQDDARQSKRVNTVFESEEIFISSTVILETEWVLRSSCDLPRESVADAIRRVLGLSNVTVDNASAFMRALQMFDEGIDIADALHFATSLKADRFGTFDAKLVKRARILNQMQVIAL